MSRFSKRFNQSRSLVNSGRVSCGCRGQANCGCNTVRTGRADMRMVPTSVIDEAYTRAGGFYGPGMRYLFAGAQ